MSNIKLSSVQCSYSHLVRSARLSGCVADLLRDAATDASGLLNHDTLVHAAELAMLARTSAELAVENTSELIKFLEAQLIDSE